MTTSPSSLNPNAMALAKSLLVRRERPQRMWPALSAAALLALSALTFATAMIMAPPIVSEHVGHQRSAK